MKTRHVIAIGILTAIAVGLLAIGIKYTGQKPKIQTNAIDNFTNYNYNNNNPNYTITGYPEYYNNINNGQSYAFEIMVGSYQIQKQNNTITTRLEMTEIIAEDGFDGSIYQFNPSYIRTTTTNLQNKAINYIEIYQYEVTNAESQTGYPFYDWYFEYTIEIHYTDNSITVDATTFEIQDANIETFYWEEQEIPYKWIHIDIQQTLTTLNNSYTTGYTTGYQTKGSLEDGNFVSVQETMLNVLTMPFTFISQAFNVTLWPGTQYQINIGNFIKSLIAIATILFIIKMFTTGFSVVGNYVSGTGNNISQWRKNRSQRKLNESKARLNDRTNPNHKSRVSHVTIKKEK